MDTILALLLGYAFGSIPFGLLLTKAAGMGDVRNIGSGNIGATNVLRTGNKGLAAATLLADLLKGFIPVWIAAHYFVQPDTIPAAYVGPAPAAALGAVLGHCFPVWLGFKGGKGVATNAGVSFGLAWPIGLAYAVVWIAVLALMRISSVAGMSAVVAAAAAAALLGYPAYAPVLIAIGFLIIWLHRANIGRLKRGEEPKVGRKK
ncbi:glycerol-3-phosphate 1-O-acyltransferase PlsY [Altererythrobacter arenosus]|uniref:Glycerol-3-phosphate acyltransferase n=1 Tax=Altererythrobacter arenosus TaxID=3032592 RepID=A0ABY8FR17_9SPHN|nr:glycerol-3-phosphate 1-O-acyltransferase PlsY [Altererythrobacter sp. CAU 1644]WFL77297.1 glycerol-3-phosphate 1-O-acyltransferase PlsY [Altererythrobacter sp. CAU 1644]